MTSGTDEDYKFAVEYGFNKVFSPVIIAPAVIDRKRQWVNLPNSDVVGEKVQLKACDGTAPSVMLSPGSYGHLSLNGAKVYYPAVWSLSTCLSGNTLSYQLDCYNWNIIVQNLLWRTSKTIMLYYNEKEHHQSASPSNLKVLSLTRFLKKWSCPLKSTMACTINLLDQLAQLGYLSKDFALRQTAWLKALNMISYVYPHLNEETGKNAPQLMDMVEFYPMNYSQSLPWLPGRKSPFEPVTNGVKNHEFYEQQCKPISQIPSYSKLNFSLPWMQIADVLLIVIFNTPHYNNIPFLETMYRAIFPLMLYCGPLPLDRTEFSWVNSYKLSFITFNNPDNHTAGALNYECMNKAILMNYQVTGYLVIADDLLLLPHSLQNFNKHQMWFLPPQEVRTGEIKALRECRLGMCDYHPHWHWWEDYQQATIKALEHLEKQQHSDVFYKCYKQLIMFNGAELRPNGAYSDIYYIPSNLQQEVLELFEHFLKHKVFVEIAVPSVINCLVGKDYVEPLPGKQLWDETRDTPWLYFKNAEIVGKKYLHPTKWSYINGGSLEMQKFYCNSVIPYLFDPYERIANAIAKDV